MMTNLVRNRSHEFVIKSTSHRPRCLSCSACRRSLQLHRICLWRGSPRESILKPNWHIEAITYKLAQVARGEVKRLIITLPPRSLKSLCASVALSLVPRTQSVIAHCRGMLFGSAVKDPCQRFPFARKRPPLPACFSGNAVDPGYRQGNCHGPPGQAFSHFDRWNANRARWRP